MNCEICGEEVRPVVALRWCSRVFEGYVTTCLDCYCPDDAETTPRPYREFGQEPVDQLQEPYDEYAATIILKRGDAWAVVPADGPWRAGHFPPEPGEPAGPAGT